MTPDPESSNTGNFEYDAFISYRHTEPDLSIARKLIATLEGYRAPRNIARKSGIKKITRVFRDREELPTTTDLSESILAALKSSRFLIVVCSPRTPESQWVQKEIEIFRELRGTRYIQALLIEGEPAESFPAPLHFETVRVPDANGGFSEQTRELELLAADIRPDELKGPNRRSYGISMQDDRGIMRKSLKLLKTERLRCLAPMFNCRFDELYQRHMRRTVKNVVIISCLAIALLTSFGVYLAGMNSRLAEQTRIAVENENQARTNAREAEKQTAIARQNEEKARASATEAERQRQEAEQQKAAAEQQTVQAQQQTAAAEQQTTLARQQTEAARQQRDQALISQSLFLADLSRQQLEKGDRVLAAMLALTALPNDLSNPDRPYVQEAETALRNALSQDTAGSYVCETILEHGGLVNSIRFSPDSSKIATASDDRTAIIWDTSTGSQILTLQGHSAGVNTAEFSPDGSQLITSSADKTAIIWDAATGSPLATLEGRQGEIYGAEFSPDGSLVINATLEDNALIWDAATGKLLYELRNDRDQVEQAEFSPDGSKVLTLMDCYTVYVWDTATGQRQLSLDRVDDAINDDGIKSAMFSTDGDRILCSTDTNDIMVFDALNGDFLYRLHADGAYEKWKGNPPAFSRDAGRAIVYCRDNTIAILDTTSGAELQRLGDNGNIVLNAGFSPDGSKIFADIAGSPLARTVVWDATTFREIARIPIVAYDVDVLGNHYRLPLFSPDSQFLATPWENSSYRIWEAARDMATTAEPSDVISDTSSIFRAAQSLVQDRQFTPREKEEYFLE